MPLPYRDPEEVIILESDTAVLDIIKHSDSAVQPTREKIISYVPKK